MEIDISESDKEIKVSILNSELVYMEELVRSKLRDSRLETGGILIGNKTKEGYIIIKATDAGPNAEQYHTEFAPDIKHTQQILDKCRENWDVYWIGTWHKHPDYLDRPSGGDVRQIENFIEDKDVLDEFIALIVTLGTSGIHFNMFYMNKNKIVKGVDFKVIDEQNPILDSLKIKKIPRRVEVPIVETDYFSTKNFPPFISNLWYRTSEGKRRLEREVNEIRRLLFVEDVKTAFSDEILTIEVFFRDYPCILFICPPEYPLNPPTIGYRYKKDYKEFKICYANGWNSLMMLSDVLVKIVDTENLFDGLKERERKIEGIEKPIGGEHVRVENKTANKERELNDKKPILGKFFWARGK